MYIILTTMSVQGEKTKMLKVSATQLRNNLFDYLNKIAEGEVIIIQRNNEDVATLVPTRHTNWRDKITITPKILVEPEELIAPLEDIWEEYV